MESVQPPLVVYIRGSGGQHYSWYRMQFENTRISDKRQRIEFERVAQIGWEEGGMGGGWDVIGEQDIYWVGGFSDYDEDDGLLYVCLDVFKHNCSRKPEDITAWEKVAPRKIPRESPFFAAVSGGKKLCVVSGYELHLPKPRSDEEAALTTRDRWNSYNWSKAGEIYDPDTNSWTYLEAPMEPFRDYRGLTAALALDKEEILFNNRGSALLCDLGKDVYIFDLFDGSWSTTDPPPGLQGYEDLAILDMHSRNSRPVLWNDTFYWFTYDLRLFAYDINEESWFQSPSLANILHPLKPPTRPILVYPPISILLGLPNGQLLVIVQEDDVPAPHDACYLTLASLDVVREGQHSLNVSLRFLQPFSVDDPSFVLCDGKAMLKNAGQGGTVHG